MKKERLKSIEKKLLQYIILFILYVIAISAIGIITSSFTGVKFGAFVSNLYMMLLSLVAFLAIMTMPTPISVVLFGGMTYYMFGNGYGRDVLYMALFPIVYFAQKKGLYKSAKSIIGATAVSSVLVILDIGVYWIYYHELNINALLLIISTVLAFLYSVKKPKLIQKLFPVEEEYREAKKRALSTRIMFIIVVISFIVFLGDTYYENDSKKQQDGFINQNIVSRMYDDIENILTDEGFTNQTAKNMLNKIGMYYEGVICKDVKDNKVIEAYQKDVADELDQTLFKKQIDSVVLYSKIADQSSRVNYGGYYYELTYFSIGEQKNDIIADPQYVVYLVKRTSVMSTREAEGLSGSFSRFYVMFCLLLPTFFWLIELMITRPINSMTALVSKYVYSNEEHRNELEKQFSDLNIHSGDEIENLYHAFGKTILDMNAYIDELNIKNNQITKMQFSMISTLANVVENRDENTGSHIKRTAEYVEIIANQMSRTEKYKDILTREYIDDMKIAAPLHDMGKIKVSDTILNKPGRLTDEEYEIMKSHSSEGKRILQQTIKDFGEFDYLLVAVDMAGSHHERYDGRGYPEGLSGEDIPICARIMAVADVFDALVSKRSYKEPMPLSKAYSIIEEGRGTQFDPDAVDAFFAAKEKIEESYNSFD